MSAPAVSRDPEAAARVRYDLIVVGGGVYGIMVALEATRRGLRPAMARTRIRSEPGWGSCARSFAPTRNVSRN